MRWLLLIIVLILTGCPAAEHARDTTDTENGGDGTAATIADDNGHVAGAVQYPQVCIDHLVQCLRHPTEPGYPPLSATWSVIARLQLPPTMPEAAALRTAIGEQAADAGEQVLPGLAAAWLAVAPTDATDYISGWLAAGEYTMLDTLWHQPEIGRTLLAGLDLAALESRDGIAAIKLLRHWARATGEPIDTALLTELAGNPDGNIRLQAIGLLLAQDYAKPGQRVQLELAVWIEPELLSAACEGIKLSGDGSLADALVPLAAKTELGELDPDAAKQREPLFAAYALAYLPGEQAGLMRRKMLGAVDPAVRWQARLGELLHGDPGYWQAAVAEHGVEDFDMWVALEPVDAWHLELLPAYAMAAVSDQPRHRSLAALHLNRYNTLSSNETVVDIITTLVADDNEETRAVAWYTAGDLALAALGEQALAVVDDTAGTGTVRIAAAYCTLKVAEAQARESGR